MSATGSTGPVSSVDSPTPLLSSSPLLADFPDDRAVAVLLDRVPEFGPTYLDLVQTVDDDPGAPAVFTALADFVVDRLVAVENDRPVLERVLMALESVADGDENGTELVGYAFLDSLSPEDRRRITPWLGPHARTILDAIDAGPG